MAREVPPLVVQVEVVSLDLACRACWATITDLPSAMAHAWSEAHREPRVVQGHLLVNGQPQVWRRRRR